MLPPIKPYKVHPKMQEIIEQKRKRKEILLDARNKQQDQLIVLKQDRKQYTRQNKQQISKKQQIIYQKKLIQHNKVRQQDKQRATKIADKKAQRLIKILPERRQLIQMLRQQYVSSIQLSDNRRKQRINKIIEQQIIKESEIKMKQIPLPQKIKNNRLIDTNDGICVICLVEEACIYMSQCKHLVSCGDCQFIIRLQQKCPLCRKISKFCNLKQQGNKKNKKIFRAK